MRRLSAIAVNDLGFEQVNVPQLPIICPCYNTAMSKYLFYFRNRYIHIYEMRYLATCLKILKQQNLNIADAKITFLLSEILWIRDVSTTVRSILITNFRQICGIERSSELCWSISRNLNYFKFDKKVEIRGCLVGKVAGELGIVV